MATKQATRNASSRGAARPVKEIRLGRIRAAIWENETANGTRCNVTVSRLYKDGDNWKDSASFGRDDLPIVSKVLDRCHDWIFEHATMATSSGNGSDAANHDDHDETPF